MIELVIASFVAGILTVLAPCILPLLPVIIGGSSWGEEKPNHLSLKRPLVIVASLVVSIFIFTLLLKSTTLLLGIPTAVWNGISGGIVIAFGINLLFPALWETIMLKTNLQAKSSQLLARSQSKHTVLGDILFGAALGPVFNSCSPTYALIVAILLPASFTSGVAYLLAYSLGLGIILLLISIFGRALVYKMKWMASPHSLFQKIIGGLLVLIGLLILLGVDKHIQAFILESGWYDPIMKIEDSFR